MLCCFRVAGNVLAKIIQRLNYLNHNVASMKEEVASIPVWLLDSCLRKPITKHQSKVFLIFAIVDLREA